MIAGLTGGIGSGKSTIARLFEIMGCALFYSDTVAKDIYFEPAVKSKVTALLGKESYASETSINKAYISSRVFGNTELLHALNAIIHPAVGDAFKTFIKNNPRRLIIKESALLFEAKLTAGLDKIIVVTAPDDTRIQRVMQRDGLSHEAVMQKIKSQLPQEEKAKQADFVIYNDGKEFLIKQALFIFNALNK